MSVCCLGSVGLEKTQASTGDFIRYIGGHVCHRAIGPAREIFDRQLSEDIRTVLDYRGNPSQHIVIWSIYMIGRSTKTTAPKIIFSCRDETTRREVRRTDEDSGILERYPGIGTRDSSLPPDFDMPIQELAVTDSKNATGTGPIEAEAILCTASDSTVDKRIFVNKGHDGGFQVLRAATAGGVVQSRGEFYYLTVALIFGSGNRMHTPSLKTESPHFDIDFDGQSDTDDDENNDMQMASQGSLTPQDSCSEGRPSPSDSFHDSMDVKMEDTPTDDMKMEHIPTVDTARNDDPRLYVLWSASVSNGLKSLTCVSVHNKQPFGSLVSLEVLGDLDPTASDD